MPDDVNDRRHIFSATATIVSGALQRPIEQEIRPQSRIALSEAGGYIAHHSGHFHVEAVLSYRSAYTQVAGNRDLKPGHGWSTLTTAVIEGLNVFEVLTADRVVGQIITEHPLEGYIPRINLLGTRFENLRIAGSLVELDIDLNILGPKPANDAFYSHDPDVAGRVERQCRNLLGHGDLPADLRERYNQLSSSVRGAETFECSLVNQVAGDLPGRSYGHIIDIPDFGKVILGKLKVTNERVEGGAPNASKTTVSLLMIDLQLGCAGHGGIGFVGGDTNGQTVP